MSRLTYWLMRDRDEYVGLVRAQLSSEAATGEDVLSALLAVAAGNALGITSGQGVLPAVGPETSWEAVAGRACLLAGDDKRLPTSIWDRAQLMRTLAWMSWPVVLVVAD